MELKYQKGTRVAVSGYFDPIHRGHIEYFRLARELVEEGGKLTNAK